jgi:chemotaxis protein MotB
MKQPPIEVKMGAPEWMVTFADLMSLLLTFFVLLLSFSSMEVSKFNTLSGAVRSAFGLRSPLDISNRPSGSKLMPNKAPSENTTERKQEKEKLMIVKMREALETAGLSEHGNVKVTDEGVVLELEGDVAFASGRSELNEAALPLLAELGEMLTGAEGQLRIEGHTDNVPIRNSRFPSNWELSGARAGAVVRHLTETGVPASKLAAVGYADTRPVTDNLTAESRARNRRVQFLFVKSPQEKAAESGSEKIHFTKVDFSDAGGGAGAFFMLKGGGEEGDGTVKKFKGPPGLVNMETFLVNISDGGGERFARLQLRLTVVPFGTAQKIDGDEMMQAKMRDRILTLLTGKTYDDLASPIGKEGFRREIKTVLDPIIEDGQIEEVLFQDFVVQ